ncbi:sugar 3,4-ketoisomerase [Pseudomonas poae]|uniref:dTDP-6-deoxy-3,4-keto-hexulose isomerase n=1 Tax=Pseudomonas poae TaxID=200451 RepID=A0A2S9ETL9_9PSED|nr:FdtA/QdtA family cupin domain-containing protein [Pseudomonas poae]PRA28251.1 dTDP-6-deoxy-3,4-keto-hexulose isomerase [Pseudomonas poae]PRC19244.1 dTDP-6-deoxy-3,4-keto-hexulose isomerase [Pseudomonas poae]
MSLIKLIEFDVLGDERGQLVVLEAMKNVPFEIKRVYYLTGTKAGVPRGFHAHKELVQVAVCVSGKCLMIMDDGVKKEKVWMSSPSQGVLIDRMMWHEMHEFSADCVLLVIASELYDENDYIRSYADFVGMINNE